MTVFSEKRNIRDTRHKHECDSCGY